MESEVKQALGFQTALSRYLAPVNQMLALCYCPNTLRACCYVPGHDDHGVKPSGTLTPKLNASLINCLVMVFCHNNRKVTKK